MLKAYIVDDEPLARDELAYLLQRTKRVDIVGESDSLETAIKEIDELEPQVVFLDIQLAEQSGMELARRLADTDSPPDIVFATAYDEYALKAFEVNAVDYILKPFEEQRIKQTVDKLMKLRAATGRSPSYPLPGTDKAGGKLPVTVEERILLLDIDRILYIQSEEGKSVIVTEGGRYKVNESLAALERKLARTPIVRVHRSYLANLNAVLEIQPWFNAASILIMKDGSKVSVSRTCMKDLKQLLGL
ncbi:LytR/AlgR family response regulator transcription factor [Paenibacillus thailandensis]|uniref:LytR/AlgR family response regulator transcription factor n=1 Tax=Paenibacillus thailandensis TaxID=393250 RepID=A0ABW5QYR6_9BACL